MAATYKYVTILIFTLLAATAMGQTGTVSQKMKADNRQIFRDSLPEPAGWVNDYEGLYTEEEKHLLDSIISIYTAKTMIEITIVTLDTGMVVKEEFDDLTMHIAKTWGVGAKGVNNGILIGISRGYRKMRIQNGYGIENLISDNETKEIIDKYFIPAFKDGDYYRGTLAGLTGLIELLGSKQ